MASRTLRRHKMQKGFKISFRVAALVLAFSSLAVNQAGAAGYGFTGPEIFPINNELYGMHAADLDGDGLNDIAVVNNLRSRITLLYNRTGKKKRKSNRVFDPGQVNQLPPDARFERKSILAEVRIGGILVSDFNGDKKPDIALFGEPKKFQFIENKGNQEWAEPVSWELEAGQINLNAIDSGDLNGDKLKDVVLLADHFAFLFRQKKRGGFEDPLKIPFSGAAKAVRILDVNLDGRNDLVTLDWDSDSPVRVRIQTKSGVLGPEMQLKYPKFRAFESADIDGDGTLEWLTIGQQSGRMQVGRFRENGSAKGLSRPLMFTPLLRTGASSRGVLWTDLNGDGRSDLVYAESDQGLLQARLQNTDGRLEPARRFPSLTGVTMIQSAEFDGDSGPELFVFSQEEKQVGMINVGKNGRLPFPELFAFQGRPLAMALGRIGAQEDLTLAVLLDDEGKRSLYLRTAKDKGRTVALSKDFRASPAQMFFHDVDQDGNGDLVCLTPYEKVSVLMREKGKFREIDVVPPGGAIAQPSYGLADLDGDKKEELLLPQKNFVRAVVLEQRAGSGTWTFRVKEQINGESRSSRISAILPAANGKEHELYFLDTGRRQLSRCRRNQDGVWSVTDSRKLPVNDFNKLVQMQLNEPTIALVGLNTVAWLATDASPLTLEKELDYETAVDKGRLHDIEVGDLNDDGETDLLFLESFRNHIELARLDNEGAIKFSLRWKVFEQKTFRGRGGGMLEPREAIIADLTGDKRNDIALIVHDRILLYPQD